MTTVSSAVLDPLLAADPAGPRVTYYDDGTGERIELSTVTLVNWAAKTGNLLRDELGAVAGSRVAVFLPAHWQTAAVLFGIWWVGAEVVFDGPAEIALCTAGRLTDAEQAVGTGEIAALSLDPFGAPIDELPVGVTDYATSVRAHGDQIVPERHPGPALAGMSVPDVLGAAHRAAAARGLTAADRVASTAAWNGPDDLIATLLGPFVVGASLVQVANADPAASERRQQTEKITRSLS